MFGQSPLQEFVEQATGQVYDQARNELEPRNNSYLQGVVETYEARGLLERFGGFLDGINPLSSRPNMSSVRYRVARGLLIERPLHQRSDEELEGIASSVGILREFGAMFGVIFGHYDDKTSKAIIASGIIGDRKRQAV